MIINVSSIAAFLRFLREKDLTPNERDVCLMVLLRGADDWPAFTGYIAKCLGMHKSNVTRALKRPLELGILEVLKRNNTNGYYVVKGVPIDNGETDKSESNSTKNPYQTDNLKRSNKFENETTSSTPAEAGMLNGDEPILSTEALSEDDPVAIFLRKQNSPTESDISTQKRRD